MSTIDAATITPAEIIETSIERIASMIHRLEQLDWLIANAKAKESEAFRQRLRWERKRRGVETDIETLRQRVRGITEGCEAASKLMNDPRWCDTT